MKTMRILTVLLLAAVLLLCSSCEWWAEITDPGLPETKPPRTETEGPPAESDPADTDPVRETEPPLPPETDAVTDPETEAPSKDYVVENGVLKEYLGKGGELVLPDEVTEIPGGVFAASGVSGSILSIRLGKNVNKIDEEAFSDLYLLYRVDPGKNPNYFFDEGVFGRKDCTQFFFFDGSVFDRDTYSKILRNYHGKTTDELPSEIVFRRGVVRGEFLMGDFCAESISSFGHDVELPDISSMSYDTVVFDFDDWNDTGFVYSYLYSSGGAGDIYVFTEDAVYEYHTGASLKADNFLERVPTFFRDSGGRLNYAMTARRYMEGKDDRYYTGADDFYKEEGLVAFDPEEGLVLGKPQKTLTAAELFPKEDTKLKKKAEENRETYLEYLVTNGEYPVEVDFGDFTVSGDRLLAYLGEGGTVTVPDFIVKIEKEAFAGENAAEISELILGEKVASISQGAFSGIGAGTVFTGNEFFTADGTLLYNEEASFVFCSAPLTGDDPETAEKILSAYEEKKCTGLLTFPFATVFVSSNGATVRISTIEALGTSLALSGERIDLDAAVRLCPVSGTVLFDTVDGAHPLRLITPDGVLQFEEDTEEPDAENFADLILTFALDGENVLRFRAERRYLSLSSDPLLFLCFANDAGLADVVTGTFEYGEDGPVYTMEEEQFFDPEEWREVYGERFTGIWETLGEEEPEDPSLEYLLARNTAAYEEILENAKNTPIGE